MRIKILHILAFWRKTKICIKMKLIEIGIRSSIVGTQQLIVWFKTVKT